MSLKQLKIDMTLATNAVAKFAAVVAGVGLVATSFAFAPSAKAQTVEELQALIAQLTAQLAALSGGGSSAGYTFSVDLTLGSTGADVTALQNFLISNGYSIPAGATGYFGSQTQAALASYQAANGIAPAAGYFGPITRQKVNMSGGTSGGSTGSGDGFSGTDEGYLDEFDQLSAYSTEEVGEGEEDVAVLGVEMEAVDADQKIERVTVEIDTPTDASEDDLEDFITDVSVWLDGDELGRMDVDEASYDRSSDEYVFRFINLGGVIEEGDLAELVVAVSGVNNLDTNANGDGWTVNIPANGIRAVSPNGVDDTYDSTNYDETFTVETFASAADLELEINLADENPDEGVVVIDNEGDEIVLLEGELMADGGDILIYDLPFNFATSGATLLAIADKAVLEIDGEEFTENIASNGDDTVTFDDLEIEISEDDTVSFRLWLESATSSVSDAQDITVSANLTETSIDAEDETGEAVASGDISGTADGETQHLFSVVPMIEVVSVDIDPVDNGNAAAEAAAATIVVKVTAKGGTIYLNGDDESTENKRFFVGDVYGSGISASTTASSTTYSLSGTYTTTNSGADNEYYTITENKSVTFTINSIINQATVTTSQVLAGLQALMFQYGTATTDDTSRSAIDLDWSDLTDQTQTGTTPLVNPS